jgi:hypothetical protein
MIRLSAFIWLAVLTLIGVGLYQVELGVLAKEAELRQINRQIDADRDAIHVLDAEWSYLNDPTRLADLARRYTDLVPTTTAQISTFDQLPPRQRDVPPATLGLPDGTMPHPEGLPDGNKPDSKPGAAPLLSSAQPPASQAPASPAQVSPAQASATQASPAAPDAGSATGNPVVQATVKTQKPAEPKDEQAEADGVIDAILADMRKAQQK